MIKSMLRILAIIFVICLLSGGAAHTKEKERPVIPGKVSFPASAAVEVPMAPIPVRANGKTNLVYELHISNLGKHPVSLAGIDVFADDKGKLPLVSYKNNNFKDMLGHFGKLSKSADIREIKPGIRVVAYIWVTLDGKTPVPDKLYHRITFKKCGDSGEVLPILDAPAVTIDKESPPIIHSPLYGKGWLAAEGPINIKDYSHHRFGVLTLGGKPRVPQRFAIDWMKFGPDGKLFHGDPLKNENWYCYGEKIYSIADGVVMEAKDGIPDNVPLKSKRAVPMNLKTICGNYVVIDNGCGRFALYAHMKPGSVRVKVGDKVKAGQVLGLLGNSGNSDAPHLHFHISDTPSGSVLAAEGMPYHIESFQWAGKIPVPFSIMDIKGIGDIVRKKKPEIKPEERKNEVPLGYQIYNFSK